MADSTYSPYLLPLEISLTKISPSVIIIPCLLTGSPSSRMFQNINFNLQQGGFKNLNRKV
jgi:hypothetical protein